MAEPIRPFPGVSAERAGLMFPTLTPAQRARVATHGTLRRFERGERLVDAGAPSVPFFVVMEGEIQIVRPDGDPGTIIAVHRPGQFTGEANMLSGRRSMMRTVGSAPGAAVELTREELLALVQIDPEIGDILMRAFIYRRVELVAQHLGDVVLVGSTHSAATLRIREFLSRNGHPFAYVDLDRDADVQTLLDRFHVAAGDIPVLICRGDVVLRIPTNQQIADCLGFNAALDPGHVRDVVVVGAGPAGLAAAVYGASEGLDVLVLDSNSPGGQAGSTSKIENYLGFPTGVSGQELADRAYAQAQKFGAQIMIARGATGLACDRKPYSVRMDDGSVVRARTVVIASGVQYRRPTVEGLERFENAGVYHAATFIEAQLCGGEDVIVVGGGNSAGQAAVFLAQTAKRVRVFVRSAGLAASMSRYLIRRIEESPTIELHTCTEVIAVEGNGHLERVRFRDQRNGVIRADGTRHVFLMTGAVPNSGWLDGCVALDGRGFIKTGADLTLDELTEARWPLTRPPRLLETSLPGVFAVGDIRAGSLKRVASAVGEGSIAISFVHQALGE